MLCAMTAPAPDTFSPSRWLSEPRRAVWVAAIPTLIAMRLGGVAVAAPLLVLLSFVVTAFSLRYRDERDQTRLIRELGGAFDRFEDRIALPRSGAEKPGPDAHARDHAEALGARMSTAAAAIAKRDRLVRAALDELERVLDAVEEPVMVVDHRRIVRLCNEAAARTLGGEGAPVAGRAVEELFTQDEVLRMVEGARAGSTHRQIVRITHPEAPAIYEVSAVPVVRLAEDEWPDVVITLRDVTELAEAAQLKTDFVANASHELRTPLSSIQMAAETLEGELEHAAGDTSEPQPLPLKLTRVIRINAERLGELVNDLLDLTRLESPASSVKSERIDLTDMLDRIEAIFEARVEERQITVRRRIDPACAALRSDPSLLELILRNLVDNATKFCRPGRAVTVEAEPDGAGGVVFRVTDKGIGIPLDQQRRIFERFYQVDPARTGAAMRGTGLGLAIVKHASIALGGDVDVKSVWQQGTTFTVRLPAAVANRDS